MAVATFDTYAAVRKMEQSGMETIQAEAVIDAVRGAVSEGLATKEDIADVRIDIEKLRADTRTEIEKLRADTRTEIEKLRAQMRTEIEKLRAQMEKLRAELTWRMVLVVGTLLALFTALERLLG